MKKVIIASVAMFFAALTNVNAASTNNNIEQITNQVSQDTTEKRSPVIPADLPTAVQQTITNEYAGWAASSAFLVTKKDKEYYEIKLTKDDSEPTIVKIDKEGKKAE